MGLIVVLACSCSAVLVSNSISSEPCSLLVIRELPTRTASTTHMNPSRALT